MNVFGYEKNDDDLLQLEEVSIQVSLEELKKINKFIEFVIDQMNEHPNTFCHEHLSDFVKLNTYSEIIIIKD